MAIATTLNMINFLSGLIPSVISIGSNVIHRGREDADLKTFDSSFKAATFYYDTLGRLYIVSPRVTVYRSGENRSYALNQVEGSTKHATGKFIMFEKMFNPYPYQQDEHRNTYSSRFLFFPDRNLSSLIWVNSHGLDVTTELLTQLKRVFLNTSQKVNINSSTLRMFMV